MNLATARSAGRAKEVGVSKVSGVSKSGLITQFLGESVLIVAIATIMAVILVYLLTPAFNELTGKTLSPGLFKPAGLALLAGMVLTVGIASGFYPAFVLASFNPIDVLKGTLSPGSMSKRLRGILVVFQYAVSIVIIIGSIVVYTQLNFITRKDIGFDKNHLIVVRRSDAFWRQQESFREQVLKIEGVSKAGFSRQVPGMNYSNNAFFRDDDPENKTYLLQQSMVSFDYPEALGVGLVEGRFFSREYGTDSTAVLINEAAVKSLGLKEPVAGQYIRQPSGPGQFQRYKIIGVMKDFNITSIHKSIDPVCFTVLFPGGGDQYATIRLTGTNTDATIKEIEKTWKTFTYSQPFQYEFVADMWNNLYSSEIKTGKIFIIFSVLAVFIACLGLIGLVTFMTNKRTREIGIRKAYGASMEVVLNLLLSEVAYLILIASVIAYPIAFFGAKYWMEGFADKARINTLIYVLSTLTVIIIGVISISFRTVKAARYSPAKALRIQ